MAILNDTDVMTTKTHRTDVTATTAAVDASAALREAGLRVTLPRLAVLDVILATGDHLAAEEIRERLEAADVNLPRSSVFNILSRLSDSGLIRRLELGGPTRFEREGDAHDHFRCTSCGLVENVGSAEFTRPAVDGRIDSATVLYAGLCETCLQD